MAILTARTYLLAKAESTYGTDAAPAVNADIMRVSDVTLNPLVAEPVDRPFFRGGFGASPTLITGNSATVTFSVELAGNGINTAGAAQTPAYAALLKACGMSETITAATSSIPASTAYNTNTESEDSVTIYVAFEDAVHKIVGARGTFTVEFSREAVPNLQFSFTGIYVAPTSTTFANAALGAFAAPLPFAGNNTTVTGTNALLNLAAYSMSFDLGVSTVYQDIIGQSGQVIFNGRSCTLNITRPMPDAGMSTEAVRAGATDNALTIQHGNVDGNRISFGMPRIQISNTTAGETDGIRTEVLDCRLLPDTSGTANDGDFSLTYTGSTTS